MGKIFAPVEAPAIHKIERWWSSQSLTFLCELKGAIDGLRVTQKTKDLLLVAFCRTLIKISNAAFNHQSMSFKEGNAELDLTTNRAAIFRADVAHVMKGCSEEIYSIANVQLQDARCLKLDSLGKFDLVITSPPYANRMSYCLLYTSPSPRD